MKRYKIFRFLKPCYIPRTNFIAKARHSEVNKLMFGIFPVSVRYDFRQMEALSARFEWCCTQNYIKRVHTDSSLVTNKGRVPSQELHPLLAEPKSNPMSMKLNNVYNV
jgi:hypothetical protein